MIELERGRSWSVCWPDLRTVVAPVATAAAMIANGEADVSLLRAPDIAGVLDIDHRAWREWAARMRALHDLLAGDPT